MIGWLSGRVRHIDPAGTVVVETHGVGYEVTLSMQTLCRLQVGAECELFIHTHVREDQLLLFGFGSSSERELFRKLTSVSGIGAKIALNMLSGMSEAELLDAIEQSDDSAIARTPGIGKKTAQRVILELRGKLTPSSGTLGSDGCSGGSSHADLRSALSNLGYKTAAIDRVLRSGEFSGRFETDFKNALKALS
ncbi:MAG: Holliday junction branch migration protein RuvA [Mariprofundales bacterium]|nr:Holliday junction branch migration protein RuvA [Mariprofundales bacterium]